MKAVVIYDSNQKPLFIAKIEDLSIVDFVAIKKQCEENRAKADQVKEWKEKNIQRQIDEIVKDVKVLKGEE